MSFDVLTWQNFQKRTISLQDKIGEYMGSSFTQYPGVYTGFAVVAAIAAHVFLLLFPLLVLVALYNFYHVITADAVDRVLMVIWLTIGLLAAYISYGFVRVKIVPPAGLPLTKADAPELFRLIEQATNSFGRPEIHRVVVTGDYELDISKVPHWFLPVWSSNVLIVGLPVLLCHSPAHFACMVNRRVGQFSRRYNMVTNWLYQLRSTWPMYRFSIEMQKVDGVAPHSHFYSLFVRLYCFLTTVAARKEELNADSYAMEVYNDVVVCEMITADAVYRYYLQKNYWPAVEKIIAISPKTELNPYAKMTAAVNNKLAEQKIFEMLADLETQEPTWNDDVPSLRKRLANIGHVSPCMKLSEGDSAATIYLGGSAGNVTEEVGRRWLAAGADAMV
jgi:hypothetical protein